MGRPGASVAGEEDSTTMGQLAEADAAVGAPGSSLGAVSHTQRLAEADAARARSNLYFPPRQLGAVEGAVDGAALDLLPWLAAPGAFSSPMQHARGRSPPMLGAGRDPAMAALVETRGDTRSGCDSALSAGAPGGGRAPTAPSLAARALAAVDNFWAGVGAPEAPPPLPPPPAELNFWCMPPHAPPGAQAHSAAEALVQARISAEAAVREARISITEDASGSAWAGEAFAGARGGAPGPGASRSAPTRPQTAARKRAEA